MKRVASLELLRAAVVRLAPGVAPLPWTDPMPARPERLFIDDHCANCLEPLPNEEPGLYCSPLCKETAKDVRYIRRKERDPEQLEDPDILDAIHTKIAHLLGGGYDAKARRIPPGVRDLIWTRDEGKCVECGAPSEEIDHKDGSSNEPGNPQLLCSSCHRVKTALRMKPTSGEQDAWVDELYRERINPDPPVYLADGEVRWQVEWPALLAARGQRREAAVHCTPAVKRRKFTVADVKFEFIPGRPGLTPIEPSRIRDRSRRCSEPARRRTGRGYRL